MNTLCVQRGINVMQEIDKHERMKLHLLNNWLSNKTTSTVINR